MCARPIHMYARPMHMFVADLRILCMLTTPFPCLNDQVKFAEEADSDKSAQKDVSVMPNHVDGKSGGSRGLAIQAELSNSSKSKSEQKRSGGGIVLIAPDALDAIPEGFSRWTELLASEPEKKPVHMPVHATIPPSHLLLLLTPLFLCIFALTGGLLQIPCQKHPGQHQK